MPDYTSICCCKNSNYQIDHGAKTTHDAICRFEKWCIENEVVWAHLFDVSDGVGVKSFIASEGGLVDFKA